MWPFAIGPWAMTAPSAKPSFLTVFQQHFERYPLMQLEDFYKLVHQAHFGPGHMVPNATAALVGLINEAKGLGDGPAEPMFDPITPNGSVVRVHLRPYLAYGGSLEQLADSFIRTANGFKGSGDELMECWGLLVALATKGFIPFSREETARVWQVAQANRFPASHHSPTFRQAYRPTYRVIAKDFWP